MTTQENERKRIAQELHDSIGQSLSAIKYSLERAVEMTRGRPAPAAPSSTDDRAGAGDRRVDPLDRNELAAVDARRSRRGVGRALVLPRVRRDLTHRCAFTRISVTDEPFPSTWGRRSSARPGIAQQRARHAQAKNVFVSMRSTTRPSRSKCATTASDSTQEVSIDDGRSRHQRIARTRHQDRRHVLAAVEAARRHDGARWVVDRADVSLR